MFTQEFSLKKILQNVGTYGYRLVPINYRYVAARNLRTSRVRDPPTPAWGEIRQTVIILQCDWKNENELRMVFKKYISLYFMFKVGIFAKCNLYKQAQLVGTAWCLFEKVMYV